MDTPVHRPWLIPGPAHDKRGEAKLQSHASIQKPHKADEKLGVADESSMHGATRQKRKRASRGSASGNEPEVIIEAMSRSNSAATSVDSQSSLPRRSSVRSDPARVSLLQRQAALISDHAKVGHFKQFLIHDLNFTAVSEVLRPRRMNFDFDFPFNFHVFDLAMDRVA